ncbi:hypothetical protein M441DRAFT_307746 [Trichoderma asperellum CBS 433.97]|uniref:Uncharacterized protein n=1 Tax=Trichoderma asperellum (strain ATCC 204424 / CBS 433.97 / NBRC 101777) TaxID=1042311 RepID=A0A2T3ZK12_TRIA4|nr:hypothetical protein M441DRAFT_307746 [Trichoderma asperellum CBS 433.97]PTB45145.1 hypothetical protein M441DRAFT_307746 [Trichoderma asperellum CBS 433.97]
MGLQYCDNPSVLGSRSQIIAIQWYSFNLTTSLTLWCCGADPSRINGPFWNSDDFWHSRWAAFDNQGASLQHSAGILVTLMRGCTAIYPSHWPGTGQRILHSLAVRLIIGLIIFCQMSINASPLSDVARPLLPFSGLVTQELASVTQVLCWIAS